jgi:hypothetical protein
MSSASTNFSGNVSPYPIHMVQSSSTIPATAPFSVPVPAGSIATSGTWTLSGIPSFITVTPYAPNGGSLSGLSNGSYGMTQDDLAGINGGGTFTLWELNSNPITFDCYISVTLGGTFPVPPSPPGITIPPWPGVPVYPTYPGWPGDPSLPASGVPFPGWPGGSLWPGYNEWYGTSGSSGWFGWGDIMSKLSQGDYGQCSRYRGRRESIKVISIEKSVEKDVQMGILKSEYLSFLQTNNAVANNIASEYSIRLLQHYRAQIGWRIQSS